MKGEGRSIALELRRDAEKWDKARTHARKELLFLPVETTVSRYSSHWIDVEPRDNSRSLDACSKSERGEKVFREEFVDDTIERPVYFRSPILLLLPSLIDNNREKYASRSAKFSPNSNSRWIDENRRDVWTRCAFTLGGLVGGGISRIIGGICRARGFFNFAIEQSRWTNNGPVNIAIRPNPISKPERTINDTRWGEESWPREVKMVSRR